MFLWISQLPRSAWYIWHSVNINDWWLLGGKIPPAFIHLLRYLCWFWRVGGSHLSLLCGRHVSHSIWQCILGQRTPCRSHSSAPPGPPQYCGCSGPSLPSPARSHWASGSSPWRCKWPHLHHQSYQTTRGAFHSLVGKNNRTISSFFISAPARLALQKLCTEYLY